MTDNPLADLHPLKAEHTFEDIPDEMGPHCRRILPEDIRRILDGHEINGVEPKPGKCRFCGTTLPFTHYAGGSDHIPLLQCDRATLLYDRAEAIRLKRIADYHRRQDELEDTPKSKKHR